MDKSVRGLVTSFKECIVGFTEKVEEEEETKEEEYSDQSDEAEEEEEEQEKRDPKEDMKRLLMAKLTEKKPAPKPVHFNISKCIEVDS